MSYNVVLLVEQPLSALDAEQVRSLHADMTDTDDGSVRYHLLLPVEDAAQRVESTMGALSAGELMASPAVVMDIEDVQEMRIDMLERARADLLTSLRRLQEAGGDAVGEITTADPLDALAQKVRELSAREVIVMTRPHVVAEFFHVDWSSRARRKLGVPVLHLMERETFDEQAGGGEGVTGL